MVNFDKGVKSYIYGVHTVRVHFPVNHRDVADICCYQCNMFSRNTGICQLTKEISEYPTQYVGSNCPLKFEGEIKILEDNKNEEN